MEKRPLIQRIDFLWSGFDKTLGLIVLGLAFISIVTFISASSGTPIQLFDQIRNLLLSYSVMWLVSRVPPKWLQIGRAHV